MAVAYGAPPAAYCSSNSELHRLHPDLNSLLQRRQETSTMRDLWNQAKRAKDVDRKIHEKYFTKNKQPIVDKSRDPNMTLLMSLPAPVRTLSAAVHGIPLPMRSLPANAQRRCRSLPRKGPDDDENLKPPKFYTAITQRNKPRKGSPEYDALVRDFVPLPRLFEPNPIRREYKKSSITAWKQQVVKVVPGRPKFSAPANAPSPTGEVEYNEDFLQNTCPTFHLADHSGPDRHFYVNPEWLSEKVHFKTGKAYKTTLVLG